ncbi:hypothetical protein [Endozoicomonas sp. GU-1]|uniref:hypothetical protein n=1 Tax=Endozoicomonas sp. GU-1 TaxID=3009078 RepID=UPI0022B54F35|nr:hypothetical protein [Endozoicomonas sp. GU-1]WBA83862.1 hypothetical protein O2T12_12445 [Endozoicomonas sp. GU-1]WBA86840.1 hypothetical protein O3276_02000 [Endozoicomonas sp. GU-1]
MHLEKLGVFFLAQEPGKQKLALIFLLNGLKLQDLLLAPSSRVNLGQTLLALQQQ